MTLRTCDDNKESREFWSMGNPEVWLHGSRLDLQVAGHGPGQIFADLHLHVQTVGTSRSGFNDALTAVALQI